MMNILARYKRLTFWNKLAAIGALAGIIGIPLTIVLYLFSAHSPGTIDVEKYISPYRNQINQMEQREIGYQSQIKALTEAVVALAKAGEKPDAPKGIKQSLAELSKGQPQAAERIFREILDRKSSEGKDAYNEAAEAARHLGALAFLSDTKRALESYRRAVELDPTNPDGWYQLGLLLDRVGDWKGAEKAYREYLGIGLSMYNMEIQAVALNGIGVVRCAKGDLDLALEYHNAALVIAREIGFREEEANSSGNIGIIYGTKGDMELALRHFNDALVIIREIGNRLGEAAVSNNIGSAYTRKGDLDQALKHCNFALAIAREIGHHQGESIVLGNIGVIYGEKGEWDRGLGLLNDALAICRKIGYVQGEACLLHDIGCIYRDKGEMGQALRHLEGALSLIDRFGLNRDCDQIEKDLSSVRSRMNMDAVPDNGRNTME